MINKSYKITYNVKGAPPLETVIVLNAKSEDELELQLKRHIGKYGAITATELPEEYWAVKNAQGAN